MRIALFIAMLARVLSLRAIDVYAIGVAARYSF